jgi:hypothetical protein
MHPRVRVPVRADLLGSEVALGIDLDDVSLGGCRVGQPAWEPKGQPLQIVLDFTGLGVQLTVRGEVVRASATDLGVRFVELSDDQKWGLRKHLRDLQARER